MTSVPLARHQPREGPDMSVLIVGAENSQSSIHSLYHRAEGLILIDLAVNFG